ncbi:MAG: DNA-processing protein DprA [Oscillospiraceae bacterium]|nr:DNA-processing protein DprA [Oscillospiraceae bacterium]
MNENLYCIWLSLACGAGSPVPQKLLSAFGDAAKIYEAGEEEFNASENLDIDENIMSGLLDKNLDESEKILEFCDKNNVSILNCGSGLYPKRLRNIRAFPAVLYYRGRLPDIDDNLCIAMVGTRRMTEYGKNAAYELAGELALCGAVIVSGMAGGIDTVSHKGCIAAGGFTIAVFGCGIDRVYPPENKELMNKIIETGLIITEYAPGTEPKGVNFPIRNRIISGLSQAVLVVEADNRSGALITAKTALFQGRGLYAVPGNINSKNSRGSNNLLKNRAGIVTDAYDILSEYEHLYSHRINIENSRYYKGKKDFYKNKREKEQEKQAAAKISDKIKESAAAAEPPVDTPAIPLGEKLAALQIILNEAELKVFAEFYSNPGQKLRSDDIVPEDMNISDVINTLTFLEIYGIITSFPGDYYTVSEGFLNL